MTDPEKRIHLSNSIEPSPNILLSPEGALEVNEDHPLILLGANPLTEIAVFQYENVFFVYQPQQEGEMQDGEMQEFRSEGEVAVLLAQMGAEKDRTLSFKENNRFTNWTMATIFCKKLFYQYNITLYKNFLKKPDYPEEEKAETLEVISLSEEFVQAAQALEDPSRSSEYEEIIKRCREIDQILRANS